MHDAYVSPDCTSVAVSRGAYRPPELPTVPFASRRELSLIDTTKSFAALSGAASRKVTYHS